jgi:hypothetical protein
VLLTFGSFRGGRPREKSNSYCHPGRAGGTPKISEGKDRSGRQGGKRSSAGRKSLGPCGGWTSRPAGLSAVLAALPSSSSSVTSFITRIHMVAARCLGRNRRLAETAVTGAASAPRLRPRQGPEPLHPQMRPSRRWSASRGEHFSRSRQTLGDGPARKAMRRPFRGSLNDPRFSKLFEARSRR